MENFESMYIDGYTHKLAAFKYDNDDRVVYLIGSFISRQLLDNCLSIMQKGLRIRFNGKSFRTIRRGYNSKILRIHDENNGDGVHCIIYAEDDNIIKVYQGENRIDKVFDYLKTNTQCGLINDWKSYIFNELYSSGHIQICDGYDSTGKSPEILIMKDIDTDLVRTIKSVGLRNGSIRLPVDEVKEIDTNISFLEIIENLIIPNIESENCHYNIGDEISDLISSPVINQQTGNKKILYPRQQIITAGCLNAIKAGITAPVINLGMGVGKSLISSRIAISSIKEHFNKKNARIGLLIPGHLLNKWIRELEDSYYPLGIKPKFYVINRFTDVDKLPQKPIGLEIIIFLKDTAKRSYLHEYFAQKKHTYKTSMYKYINSVAEKYKNDSKKDGYMILKDCNSLSFSEMKIAAIKLEKICGQKVTLYKAQYNNNDEIEGYKVISTSKTMHESFGKLKKSYDFFINDIQRLEDVIKAVKPAIKSESILKEVTSDDILYNPLVCPICGNPVYIHGLDIFDSNSKDKYERLEPKTMNLDNLHCQGYIKADGSNLSKHEISQIRNNSIDITITDKSTKYPYLDNEGNELKGDELVVAKRKGSNYSILVRRCNHKLWGSKNKKGYLDYDSAKYYFKRFGSKSIDILIADEVHQYLHLSNQKFTFTYLCKSSKIILPLTGTLTGGKASDLFYLLWDLYPQRMRELGFKFNEHGKFVDIYGRRKRTTKTYLDTYNKSGSGRTVSGSWIEIPGISPQIINQVLSEVMVSRTIDDMGMKLPKLRYIKHVSEMDEDLAEGYNNLKFDILKFINQNRGLNVAGIYLNSLLSYPDMPQQAPLYACNGELYIATPKKIDIDDRLFNKERKLIETIENELAEGRRVLVYSVFSGIKGVSKRLVDILSKKFKVAELTSNVKLQKREEWIELQYQNNVQVIITNPKCVETGLDIIQYPTLYFYETSYDIKVMRQAERRAYRPNSIYECRIYYSYYKDTLQEDALKLQGNKKASSLAVEGVFSEDMLSQFGDMGESPASILNKILEGKIKMKESDLDAFGFEDEVSYEFNNIVENDTNLEVTRTITTTESVILPKTQVNQLSIFEIDEEFLKQRKAKKQKSKISLGQLGFIFE